MIVDTDRMSIEERADLARVLSAAEEEAWERERADRARRTVSQVSDWQAAQLDQRIDQQERWIAALVEAEKVLENRLAVLGDEEPRSDGFHWANERAEAARLLDEVRRGVPRGARGGLRAVVAGLGVEPPDWGEAERAGAPRSGLNAARRELESLRVERDALL